MASLSSSRKLTFFLALIFTVVLYALEEFFLGPTQGWFLNFTMNVNPTFRLVGYMTTFTNFSILFCLVWISLSAPRAVRIALAILISAALLAQFSYWHAVHRFISPVDLETATKSTVSLWTTAFSLFFSPLAFIPVLIYWIFFILAWKQVEPRLALGLLIPIVLLVLLNSGLARAGFAVNPGTSLPRLFQTIAGWAVNGARVIPREEISPFAHQAPANNIVLVIDESIRSDHLSINGYSRPTTPYLETIAARPALLHNWGTAVSGATCSTGSNALLITGVPVSPQNADRIQDMIRSYPTLFNYARAMGYRTYYFQAQVSYLYNGMEVSDLKYVNEWINTRQLIEDNETDFRAADRIHALVSSSTGNFIVLNKRGVHFEYEGSYPPTSAVWLPTPTNYLQQPALVKNAYDNGILYNVNTFFTHLIPDVDADTRNTVYIYTSDHGQTLFEHGETWLHCNYTPNEASIPLLLIGRLPQPPDVRYPASHANIVPTLLDLMSVPPELRPHTYLPSLLRAALPDLAERYYLDGTFNVVRYPR